MSLRTSLVLYIYRYRSRVPVTTYKLRLRATTWKHGMANTAVPFIPWVTIRRPRRRAWYSYSAEAGCVWVCGEIRERLRRSPISPGTGKGSIRDLGHSDTFASHPDRLPHAAPAVENVLHGARMKVLHVCVDRDFEEVSLSYAFFSHKRSTQSNISRVSS